MVIVGDDGWGVEICHCPTRLSDPWTFLCGLFYMTGVVNAGGGNGNYGTEPGKAIMDEVHAFQECKSPD